MEVRRRIPVASLEWYGLEKSTLDHLDYLGVIYLDQLVGMKYRDFHVGQNGKKTNQAVAHWQRLKQVLLNFKAGKRVKRMRPTPKEIKKICWEIQDGWSPAEERMRRDAPPPGCGLMFVSTSASRGSLIYKVSTIPARVVCQSPESPKQKSTSRKQSNGQRRIMRRSSKKLTAA